MFNNRLMQVSKPRRYSAIDEPKEWNGKNELKRKRRIQRHLLIITIMLNFHNPKQRSNIFQLN